MNGRCNLAATLLLWACPAIAAPRLTVELLPQARVAGNEVTLGEIAHLRSSELDLMRSLVTLPVGQAPQAGQPALVRREALANWVRRVSGLPVGSLEFIGADESRIERAVRLLKAEEIVEAARQAATASRALGIQASELRPRSVPRDLEVPEGPLRLDARTVENVAMRGSLLVWVDIRAAERLVRSVAIMFEITGFPMPGAELRDPSGAMGPRITEQPSQADVLRGESAALRVASGVVSLESRVEVLQDGRVGQRVRVRANHGAGGVLFAKVVGRGLLELAP